MEKKVETHEVHILHPEHPGTPEVLPDVISDPALNTKDGQDWTDEGGAMEGGPAT